MPLYIHYGSAAFVPRYFSQVTNRESHDCPIKPCGGLWASRVGDEFGWYDFCKSEFKSVGLDTYFRFLITPAARVCHLYSCRDLAPLPHRNDCSDNMFHFLDFEQMIKDGWDAIELHLYDSEYDLDDDGDLSLALWGWDCNSILIMNPKVISPLTHI